MGKLVVVSDLHSDINQFEQADWQILVDEWQKNQVTHVHIAGDTANTKATALQVVDFIANQIPTTFHWGNHEMVDLTEAEIEDYQDRRFLNFRTVPLSENVWLLGVNGWYDYQFAVAIKRDFSRLKQLAWYDRMIYRPLSDPELMRQLAEQLEQFMQTVPKTVELIVSTHFVPHPAFIRTYRPPYQKWNQMNAFLGSPDFGEIFEKYSQVKHVVFGHTHHRFEPTMVNGITYHCRPLGYSYEWQQTFQWIKEQGLTFSSMNQVKQILSDNQLQFAKQKSKFLRLEAEQAQTIIEYK